MLVLLWDCVVSNHMSFQPPEENIEMNELTKRLDELGRELMAKEEQVLYIIRLLKLAITRYSYVYIII